MEDGPGQYENPIEYEIAGLSKFMTIYTYCTSDAVGVRHARTVQGRSTNCYILITLHVKAILPSYLRDFFFFPFLSVIFWELLNWNLSVSLLNHCILCYIISICIHIYIHI